MAAGTFCYLFVVILSGVVAKRLVIDKCCPMGSQLSQRIPMECMPLPKGNIPSDGFKQVNISVYNSRSLELLLETEYDGSFLNYRGSKRCDWSRTKFISTGSDKGLMQLLTGSIVVNALTSAGFSKSISLSSEEYCVDSVNEVKETLVYLICPCEKVQCINKCCHIPEILKREKEENITVSSCKKIEEVSWTPSFVGGRNHGPDPSSPFILLENRSPMCEYGYEDMLYRDIGDKNKTFLIFSNGSAFLEVNGVQLTFSFQEYCGDKTLFLDGNVQETIMYCRKDNLKEERVGGKEEAEYKPFYNVSNVTNHSNHVAKIQDSLYHVFVFVALTVLCNLQSVI